MRFESSLVDFRHQIHQHPEVAMEEEQTAKAVKAYADQIGFDRFKIIGKPGMIFSIWPDGTNEKEALESGLMFRAELDGLPIADRADIEYRSQIAGKGHLCGHDGHMTILLGLMHLVAELKKTHQLKEAVHFLFQPAEENGAGANVMMQDPGFDIKPERMYALHNIPGVELGKVLLKPNVFTPEVISVDFILDGATSHAAQPYLGNNPAEAVAEIITFMKKLHKYKATKGSSTFSDGDVIVAPVQIKMGQADYGISAGEALVGYTFRTYRPEHMQAIREDIEAFAKKLEANHDLSVALEWHQYFAANVNDAESTKLLEQSLIKTEILHERISSPFEWGEDFGYFSQRMPSCMFGIGSGEDTPPLHNQTYDFPDALIAKGVEAFGSIIIQHQSIPSEDLKSFFHEN
jgi:amidohydrolase